MIEIESVVEGWLVTLADIVNPADAVGPYQFAARREVLPDTDVCDVLNAVEEELLAFEFDTVTTT